MKSLTEIINNMEKKFIEAFKEVFEIEDREVHLSDNFKDYDEWDSLTQLSLIAFLDEDYEVELNNDELSKLFTVSDLVEKVKEKLKS